MNAPDGDKALRIALVDTRPALRDAFRHWFKLVARRCDVTAFADIGDLLGHSEVCSFDLIVLSFGWTATNDGTLNAIDELLRELPSQPILVLSDRDDQEFAAEVIRRGARAYIPTTVEPSLARAGIRLVLAGGVFVPPKMLVGDTAWGETQRVPEQSGIEAKRDELSGASHALGSDKPSLAKPQPRATARFTPREIQVLACLRLGKPNRIIASELGIRESTVKVHIARLMRKLKASNRTQVAYRAYSSRTSDE